MSKPKKSEFSSLMNDADYNYCVTQFGITKDHARGMTDADWMQFFDCTKADLPYYLLEEERWEEMLEDPAVYDFIRDIGDLDTEWAEYQDDFADSEIFLDRVQDNDDDDLWTSTFEKYAPVKSPSKPAWLSPRPTAFRAEPKAKPKKVPHYFVVVR